MDRMTRCRDMAVRNFTKCKVGRSVGPQYYTITSCNYPSSERSFVSVRQVSPPPSSGRSLSSVRQVSLSRSVPGVSYFCHSRTHTWMTLTLTLPETLPGWTWVRVSSLVSISPAVWPAIRNIDTDKQTNISPFIIQIVLIHSTPLRYVSNVAREE